MAAGLVTFIDSTLLGLKSEMGEKGVGTFFCRRSLLRK